MTLPAAVLFDMDGTLVDTEPLWALAVRAVASVLDASGRHLDSADVLGQPVGHTAALLAELTGTLDVEAVQDGLQAAFLDVVSGQPVRTMPGVAAVLTELRERGVRIAMVSASPRPVVEAVLRQLGSESFDAVFADGDTLRTKPFPDPYLAAAASLGVLPEDCLAVEDSPPGVASAEDAGMAVLVVGSAVPHVYRAGRTYTDSLCLTSLVAAFAGRESCSFSSILT